jgi:hypothetical protein
LLTPSTCSQLLESGSRAGRGESSGHRITVGMAVRSDTKSRWLEDRLLTGGKAILKHLTGELSSRRKWSALTSTGSMKVRRSARTHNGNTLACSSSTSTTVLVLPRICKPGKKIGRDLSSTTGPEAPSNTNWALSLSNSSTQRGRTPSRRQTQLGPNLKAGFCTMRKLAQTTMKMLAQTTTENPIRTTPTTSTALTSKTASMQGAATSYIP